MPYLGVYLVLINLIWQGGKCYVYILVILPK